MTIGPKHKRVFPLTIMTSATIASIVSTANATTVTGVAVEGVSDYSVYGGSNTDCATEASGFLSTMTQSGSGWTQGANWFDNNVWDTDFLDPDIAGGDPSDDDSIAFDNPGTAVALVCAHGRCNDASSNNCTTSSDCVDGYCPGQPPSSNSSQCIANSFSIPRKLLTSSTSDVHGHNALYAPGNARWGEDSVTGNWAGAGTNGDDNVAFLINSCAIRQPYMPALFSAFAGVALINVIMPTTNNATGFADAGMWSSRGSTLAGYALMSPNSKIRDHWDATMDSAPQWQGSSCPDQTGTYTYGGGYGIYGCGAHVSIAVDLYDGWASGDLDMSWMQARNESLASRGASYWYWWAHCNYDCITYPFQQ
jgi:hypothetical protein